MGISVTEFVVREGNSPFLWFGGIAVLYGITIEVNAIVKRAGFV